jgi:hypothetical protein
LEAVGGEGASWSFSLWRSGWSKQHGQPEWAQIGLKNGDHTSAEGRLRGTFSLWRSQARSTWPFSESQLAYVQLWSEIGLINSVGDSENEHFSPEYVTQVTLPVLRQGGTSEPFSVFWPVSAAGGSQHTGAVATVLPESLLLRRIAVEESPSSGVVWWWCCRRSHSQHAELCVGDWTFRTGM